MLGRKRRLAALALVATLVLSGVNPVTARAEDVTTETTITITKDMVAENGEVTLENLKAEEIIIPADAGATKIIMKNVVVNEMTVEEGALCDMKISGSSIERMNIANQEAKELTLRDMAKMIESGKTKAEAQKAYQQAKKEQAEKAEHTPVIELTDKADVEVLQISGNNVKLAVDGFNGELEVEHKSEHKTEQGVIQLEMTNSNPKKADISGESNGTIVITGVDAALEEAVLTGSVRLVLDVETKKLETAKESEGASVQVLASVEEAVINGAATELTIAENATVKKAEIKAEDVVVAGDGVLESAAVSSDSAKVTTEGTNVFVPTPTPAPTVAPTAVPTAAPSYGGGGYGGGSSSGGSSSGGSSSTQTPTTNPDADYAGDYKVGATIPVSKFEGLEGEVTIKVTYRKLQATSYTYYQLCVAENVDGWPKLETADFSYLQYKINEWEFIDVPGNGTTVTMTLTEAAVEEIVANGGGLLLQVYGIIIEDVAVTAGAREEDPDEGYAGDWGTGYSFSAEDIAKYSGDVTITLNYRMVTTATSYQITVYEPISGWPKLSGDDFTSLEYEIHPEWGTMDLPAGSTTTTMVIKAATVEEIIAHGAGLGIQVNGVIIESATITGTASEAKELTVKLYTEYPGSGDYSKYITAEQLKPFVGNAIALDLTYAMADGKDDVWFNVVGNTNPWTELVLSGATGIDKEKTNTTVVVSAEDLATIVENNRNMTFKVSGFYFTEVTVRVATEDDYYLGDWSTAHTFSAEELAEITGAATFTMKYRTVSTGYDYYQIKLADTKTWAGLGASSFVDGSSVNAYQCIDVDGFENEMSITITEEAMEKLISSGADLAVCVYGVMVDSATLEAVSGGNNGSGSEAKEVTLDTAYPGQYKVGTTIPKSVLDQFEGAIAIELDYVATGTEQYPGFKPAITEPWAEVPMSGNSTINATSGSLTICIEKEDVAKVIAAGDGSLGLQVWGVYFTHAVVRGAEPDDYYVGDNNEAATLSINELAGYNSDVKLTFKFRTVTEGFGYYQIFLQEKAGSWSYLTSEKFVGNYAMNEYGCFELGANATELTVTLSKDAISALAGDLKVGVYGVIIEDITIGAAE